MFEFKNTKMMNVDLAEEQYKQISSKERINKALLLNKAMGFELSLLN